MDQKRDPAKQFSKWLAKSGAIYWIVFLSALLVLMYLRPEVANACIYLALIVSVVMIMHVLAYTRNSVYEKLLLAMLDKTKMQLTMGPVQVTDGEDDAETAENEGEEEG